MPILGHPEAKQQLPDMETMAERLTRVLASTKVGDLMKTAALFVNSTSEITPKAVRSFTGDVTGSQWKQVRMSDHGCRMVLNDLHAKSTELLWLDV